MTRYFLTYSSLKLPLRLAGELDETAVRNRGTYFRATYDAQDRMVRCEKLVYGDIELDHRYTYDEAGNLIQASIACAGDEPMVATFDPP